MAIFDPPSQRITWGYEAQAGDKMLDHPSLARDLKGNAPGYLNDPDGFDIDVFLDCEAAHTARP